MTNKPMLSVERELLERFVSDVEAHNYGFDGLDEMRALLDKPACDQEQGKYARHPLKDAFTLGTVACYGDAEPAAQHQGEPVYMVRDHGSCCWEEMKGESLEVCQAQPAEYEVRKLYAEQPAPVAVVMPERRTKASYSGYIEQFQSEAAAIYNSALDDVARLNGVKP